MQSTRSLLTLLSLTVLALPASGVTITIVNKDAPSQGLNDPTPATPIGGNPGTTIGQQRLNVLAEAARIWRPLLPGTVEIKVDASFTPLDCTSTAAVLGGAAPTAAKSDFTGAPVPGTWYVVAEANQIAGTDLDSGHSAIAAKFNAKLGQTGCLDGNYFYYGFDINAPATDVSFLTLALHEFAHGLGFISLTDETTGRFCCSTKPLPDIFDAFVYDTTLRKTWNEMRSDADRRMSASNTGYVVWNGSNANAAGKSRTATGVPALMISSPSAVAGSYNAGTADFGATLTIAGVAGILVEAFDPADTAGPSPRDACSALTNSSAVTGHVALVNRGTCNFVTKARNVQAAGAIGLIVANNAAGYPPQMTGNASDIVIPIVSVSEADGSLLRANLGASVTLAIDTNWHRGMTRDGQMLLYAPKPVAPGSSISHWDTSVFPNLLMEPYINRDMLIGVDITADLFKDIGWFSTRPTANFTYSPSAPLTGQAIQFTDLSTGSPTSWSWTFGDGETSTMQNPGHTYWSAGTKTVTLIASNESGSSTISKVFSVTAAAGSPTAGFTFNPLAPAAGQAVQFNDTSTGLPTAWSWNFGDGETSNVKNPVHTFGRGTYQVSLTVFNAAGSNTRTQAVNVSFNSPVTCISNAYSMCMVNGRYRVTSHWKNQYYSGAEAALYKTQLTDLTGAFWIYSSNSYEYLIRFNTATNNGRTWVAIPTFTDVEFWIAVFDTQNGQYKEYHSLPGNRTLIYDPYFFVYP